MALISVSLGPICLSEKLYFFITKSLVANLINEKLKKAHFFFKKKVFFNKKINKLHNQIKVYFCRKYFHVIF